MRVCFGGIYETRWRKENAALGPGYFVNVLKKEINKEASILSLFQTTESKENGISTL